MEQAGSDMPGLTSSGAQVTTTTTTTKHSETSGKMSSGETSRMKKKQSDRLTVVKKRTLIVVIVADILMLAALAVQMIWLSKSLHETLQEKVDDLVGYYQFGYNERFAHLGMGVSLYGINKTGSGACQSLNGDANWQDETQKRLQHDIIGRRIEFAIVTDVNGTIWASAGPGTALGQRFNPQNVVTQFRERYPNATEQLQISLMIPSDLFQMLGSARLFVAGDDRPELRSWRNYTEVLTRTVLAPLYCGAAQLQGFQIWGDAIVPVKYDQMNRMIRSTSSAFVAIMAPNSDGNTWQTRYSYNQAGQTGWPGRFPDLVSELGSAFAERTYNGGHPLNGQFTLGPVQYMFASIPIQRTKFGSHFIDDIHSSIGLIIYAEPTYPAEEVVRTALLWHVPFGVFMAVLSVVMLFHTFRRFLDPMRALIESVKKKRLSKFNDQIRQMQQNRSALWTFLAKAVLVQGILLGLIFVNRRLIAASIHDFTSATTQGRIGKYVASSKARAMAKALNGWSGFTSIAETINSGNMTDDFRAEMQTRFHALNSDALFLLDRNANVIGATHRGAEGRAFPELGLMDYYAEALVNNTTGVRLLTALTSWPDNIVNTFTPYHYTESDPPALIRLAAASVVSPNRTLIGALVSIRLFNGFRPLWDDVVLAFGSGYYGLYEWDPFHRQFTALTTLLLTDTVRHFDVDFSNGSEEILRQGSQTAFDADGVMIRDSVLIEGASNTLSMAPYFSPIDDAVLTPLTMNAYQVTAVPQDRYDAMLAHQLEIQSSIMAFEFLTSMVALICTYWPMKRFLSNLEKAFNVPSLSQDKRQRMDETAAAMIQSGAHMEPLSVSSPRFSGVYRNVQSTVHGNRLSL